MSSRIHFLRGLVLIATFSQAAVAQRIELPRSPTDGTPDSGEATSTAISVGMSGVGQVPKAVEQVARSSSSGVRKYIKSARNEAERAARYQQRRTLMSASSQAKRIGPFLKPLGVLAFTADTVASIAGSFSVGDYQGAAVTAVDEGGETLAAMGGAAVAGSLAGSVLGPLGTVGGAVCGIAGAAVATLGYDVFISPTVRERAESYMSEPEKEFHRNRTINTLLESEENIPIPMDDFSEHLIEKLTQELRAQDAQATAAAEPPLGPVISPPTPVDPKGRKRCPYCGEFH
jgi:hypothetical protein